MHDHKATFALAHRPVRTGELAHRQLHAGLCLPGPVRTGKDRPLPAVSRRWSEYSGSRTVVAMGFFTTMQNQVRNGFGAYI
jgi:hypothetical protein